MAIVSLDIGQIALNLADRGISLAFIFIVESPAEVGSGCGREQAGDLGIGLSALSPPGSNPDLDISILHHIDVLLDDSGVGIAIKTQCWVVVGVGVNAQLVPGLGKPGIIEGGPDGERRLPVGPRLSGGRAG